MTIKNDAKFNDKLPCHFKIDLRYVTNFDPSIKSLKNLHVNWLLLNKVYSF